MQGCHVPYSQNHHVPNPLLQRLTNSSRVDQLLSESETRSPMKRKVSSFYLFSDATALLNFTCSMHEVVWCHINTHLQNFLCRGSFLFYCVCFSYSQWVNSCALLSKNAKCKKCIIFWRKKLHSWKNFIQTPVAKNFNSARISENHVEIK